jgi:CubicO group peptidase (beta-lactamase class C family)
MDHPRATALPRTCERLEAGLAARREIGVQLAVSLRGRRFDLALGEARSGVPMTPDTLVLWISMAKPVMGVAYGLLLERGMVSLDDPVERHLPAFGRGGKRDITLRHLLTHTAGFRDAWRRWYPCPPFDEVVETICAAPQEEGWVAGEHCGYNVAAAWYVLAAVLRRIDGRSYADFAREEIFLPLGMNDCWLGMPAERWRAYGDRVSHMHFLGAGGDWQTGPAWSTAEGAAIERPGGNAYGPMRELVHLYEILLGGGEREGVRILRRETVDLVLARHTHGLEDRTFRGVYDRGLGVVLDSRSHGRGFAWFGTRASERAFGHQGFFSSVSFGDPEHGLAVALAWNGVRQDALHEGRVVETVDALYDDLALAGR